MKKLLIICGPTATGKTALAIKLAKKFKGEIISADSRQVYQGMDIGTGKDLPINGIKIWLYDVVKPDQEFSAAQYYQLAWKAIKDILKRQKLPLVVGGTGFYIKVLIEGIKSLGVSPDWLLRKQLEGRSADSLLAELSQLDSFRAANMNLSDRKNKRRLVRAIEIAMKLKTQNSKVKSTTQKLKLNTFFIGLTAPYKLLYQKIDKRVGERLKKGVENEIGGLLKNRYSFDNSVLGTTIGYKEWQEYFEGKAARDEVIKKWKYNEHSYVRRQMTWFKKDKRIKWFDVSKKGWKKEIEKLVNKWYTNTDAKKN